MLQPDRPRLSGRLIPIIVGTIGGEALGIIGTAIFNVPFHDKPYFNIPIGFFAGGALGGVGGAIINAISSKD